MSYCRTDVTIAFKDDGPGDLGRIEFARGSIPESAPPVLLWLDQVLVILDDASYARLKAEISKFEAATGRSPKAVEPSADATAPGGAA